MTQVEPLELRLIDPVTGRDRLIGSLDRRRRSFLGSKCFA